MSEVIHPAYAQCKECQRWPCLMLMLKDSIWEQICENTKDYLCFSCMERKLDRPITLSDLKECNLSREFLLGAIIGRQTPLAHWPIPIDFDLANPARGRE